MPHPAPPFAAQRMLFLAMVFGITMYAIVAAVMLAQNDGNGLAEGIDANWAKLTWYIGGGAVLGALVVRMAVLRGIEHSAFDVAARKRFLSRLAPLAMLEAGAIAALTIWLLTGKNVPPLAVAMILLSIAIATVPFRDPEQGA